jgi:5-methyltetrahydrofolate--homocysteine methyltransferase
MTKADFKKLVSSRILVLDGATGTMLQKQGMPGGVCPEEWVLENPQSIINVQKAYREAGSDIVYSCTFGGNRWKLEEFGLQDSVHQINRDLARLSREAVGKDGLVAGDIAPCGKFIEPFGETPFEEAVVMFAEQASALADGGVDLFVIETMLDIQEARAALLGVRSVSDLPVMVTMTFEASGRTLTGTDAVSALITLQSLGADAVGCNCSTGPDQMLETIKMMKPFATVPLLAKPNAGLPKLVNNETVFDMTAVEYATFVPGFAKAGINIMGGCCGTSPDYIRVIKNSTDGFSPILPTGNGISAVSSARGHRILDRNGPLSIIGERINPTGKKRLQATLKAGDMQEVRRFSLEQNEEGAALLDVNMGMGSIDEKAMMRRVVCLLSQIQSLPLVIDSSSPEVIEEALRIYPGRALINSISAEKVKLTKLLPIAAKYGAMFILLPLNDDEIPKTAAGRIKLVHQIMEQAGKLGLTKNDIVIDGLVMTVSADPNAAKETLSLIDWSNNEYGVNTVVGLSNISFGLPLRKWVNSTFLSLCMANGLSMAIANPCEETIRNATLTGDLLTGKDQGSREWIKYANSITASSNGKTPSVQSEKSSDPVELIHAAVLDGDSDNLESLIKNALSNGSSANDIVNKGLIPAINSVGDLYDKKIYFLPQLIASAEVMKRGFAILEPHLVTSTENDSKITVIFATVKGDIHDIGKNIVVLMLKNYGYRVVDLGKDVDAETICDSAESENASVIALSALMTTTMTEMKTVIEMVHRRSLHAKVIVGGAVITQAYADEIGADGYSADSVSAVKLVDSLTKDCNGKKC